MPLLHHPAAEAPSGVRQDEVLNEPASEYALRDRRPTRFTSADLIGMVVPRQHPEINLPYLRQLAESQAVAELAGTWQVAQQPQATANTTGNVMDWNPGAGYQAAQANVTQVPVYNTPQGYQSGGDGISHMEMAARSAIQSISVPLASEVRLPEDANA